MTISSSHFNDTAIAYGDNGVNETMVDYFLFDVSYREWGEWGYSARGRHDFACAINLEYFDFYAWSRSGLSISYV